MKVSECRVCKYYNEFKYTTEHQPINYHKIGMSHKYGYCRAYQTRCSYVKKSVCYKGKGVDHI